MNTSIRAHRWLKLILLAALVSSVVHGLEGAPPKENRAAKRVLIIGIDGTRPDALAKANTPNLDELIRQGAFTDSAQILGSRFQKNNTISGPGWSSILTGVWADKHGVLDNDFKGRNFEAFPHFFKRLKSIRPDARTVSLVSWDPIHQFILSEADVARSEPLSNSDQIVDLRVSGDKLKINTRDNKWHHLLATRRAGTVGLYLDGQLIGETKDTAGKFDLGGPFYYIGRDTRAGETCFHGQLDNVRLWTRALTDAEIRQVSGKLPVETAPSLNRSGLLAEYLFELPPQADGTKKPSELIVDTAAHAGGPFHASPVSESQSPQFFKAESPSEDQLSSSRSLDLPAEGGKEHGVRVAIPNTPMKPLTQGDFTIEACFRTRDAGRGILMGNFAGDVGSLNLELHENNTVRVWIQRSNSALRSGRDPEENRDRTMAANAARILKEESPEAMFVYFHQVDAAGHGIGFSPDVPEYVRAIENVDNHVGTVLQALRSRTTYQQEDWLTIVCTDHGGFKTGHGDGHDKPKIRQVFLIVSGPSAKVGGINEQAFLVDVAATALMHLTGTVDKKWQLDGRPIGLKTP